MESIDWKAHFGACRPVKEFEKISQIGEGTYGVVSKARDTKSDEFVALKQVRMDRDRDTGLPLTALREIKLLSVLNHHNIVKLKGIAVDTSWDEIFLVFEYIEHDLAELIDNVIRTKPFSISEVKSLLYQLLSAVGHMHNHWIIHRDIKMSNLLYSNKGELKLADFGLARTYTSTAEQEPMTPRVVTLWYRAPELLLGQDKYGTAIDIWSIGCVFAEWLIGRPLMPGENEVDQITRMFKLLGSPNDKIWPGYSLLPISQKMNFPNQPYSNLRSKFPDLSKEGFDLLNKMLTFDPRRRITAQEALAHPFFQERPLPKDSFLMPTYPEMPKRANKRAPRAGDGRTSTISANSNNVKRNEDDQPKIVKSGGIDDTQFASDPGSYNRFNIAFG